MTPRRTLRVGTAAAALGSIVALIGVLLPWRRVVSIGSPGLRVPGVGSVEPERIVDTANGFDLDPVAGFSVVVLLTATTLMLLAARRARGALVALALGASVVASVLIALNDPRSEGGGVEAARAGRAVALSGTVVATVGAGMLLPVATRAERVRMPDGD